MIHKKGVHSISHFEEKAKNTIETEEMTDGQKEWGTDTGQSIRSTSKVYATNKWKNIVYLYLIWLIVDQLEF